MRRIRYKVTFTCADGSKPLVMAWANDPAHAIKKAKGKLPADWKVVGQVVEEMFSDQSYRLNTTARPEGGSGS